MSFDREIYEQMVHGEFGAVLSTLASIQKIASDVSSKILAMQSEVGGNSGATASTNSFVGTIHSPARLDPSTQTSIEKLVGQYFIGDQESPSDSQAETQSGSMAVGPTSEILLNFLATKSNHAVSKRFVENLVSPLYSKIASLTNTTRDFASRTFSQSSIKYMYHYINSVMNTDLTLSDTTIKDACENYSDYFTVNDHNVIVKEDGVYLMSFFLNAAYGDGNSGTFRVKLDSKELLTLPVSSSLISLSIPVNIEQNSIISWKIDTLPSSATFGLSLVKLGDA